MGFVIVLLGSYFMLLFMVFFYFCEVFLWHIFL